MSKILLPYILIKKKLRRHINTNIIKTFIHVFITLTNLNKYAKKMCKVRYSMYIINLTINILKQGFYQFNFSEFIDLNLEVLKVINFK